MANEFLDAIIKSLSVSIFLAIIFSIIARIMRKKQDIVTDKNTPLSAPSKIEGFDELIIDLTKNRIMQEISISSMIKTRTAMFMGFSGIVLNLLVIVGYTTILNLIKNTLFTAIEDIRMIPIYYVALFSGVFSIAILSTSIAFWIMIIWPQKNKLFSLDPRLINENYDSVGLEKTRHVIKEKYLNDLDNIIRRNNANEDVLKRGIRFLLVGLVLLGGFAFLTTPTTINLILGNPI